MAFERQKQWFARLRQRRPVVDHVVRTVQHYGEVQGTVLAGAVTFFGFLSFFPILVLAFAVIGYVAAIYPDAEDDLVQGIEQLLPGLVGDGPNAAISIETFKDAAGAASLVGLVSLLYTGLGWLSGMRGALQGVFQLPQEDKRSFVVGKALDVLVLGVIGLTLVLSVGLSGLVTGFSRQVLQAAGLADLPGVGLLLQALTLVLAVGASTLLFFALFALLPGSSLPRSALLKGALLAAALFEILKLLANILIKQAAQSPGAAVLGISLVLLVWINYFSRTVMLGAAWAYTSPEAVQARATQARATQARATQQQDERDIQYVPVAGARSLASARLEARRQAQRQHAVDRLSLLGGVVIGAAAGAAAALARRRA